jgi:hypothetical protein
VGDRFAPYIPTYNSYVYPSRVGANRQHVSGDNGERFSVDPTGCPMVLWVTVEWPLSGAQDGNVGIEVMAHDGTF